MENTEVFRNYTRRRSVICGNSETAFQQSYQHNVAYEFSVTCCYAATHNKQSTITSKLKIRIQYQNHA